AYDHVNIHMLKKAMYRLKLPSNFTKLITSLFLERKNSVFTAVGTTDPYDVLTGIDQGEIISPLLWCIYYDPLLCEIKARNLGYTLQYQYRSNLYDDALTTAKENVSTLAFMNDTTWITDSQPHLEEMLSIADDFYQLNNIKVNKEKSVLMAKQQNKKNMDPIALTFGNEQIMITPIFYQESTHFLGV